MAMLQVGITGGIGSGKTLVSDIFSSLQIPIYNSDIRAKEITVFDAKVRKAIIQVFGNESYASNALNREYLAKMVFSDKGKLEQLNRIIHPAVAADYSNWLLDFSNKPYVLKEAAILFESGSYKTCDKTILVTAPQELRIKRVIKRDSVSRESVLYRMKNQMTNEEKLKLSDYQITNNGEQSLILQVYKLHQQILQL
ncbi:MAG: dephospho-CoA kinase [Salibacteraceae bacterium]